MLELKPKRFIYQESRKIQFQGDQKALQKKINEGYNVVAGSNGSYVLGIPVIAKLELEVPGVIKGPMTIDVKDLVCDAYGRKRITRKLFVRFESDIKTGKKKIVTSGNGKIKVI